MYEEILERDWEDENREPTDHELHLLSRFSDEELDMFYKQLELTANEIRCTKAKFDVFLEDNLEKLTDDDLRHLVDIGVISEDFADELFISRVIPYEESTAPDSVDTEEIAQKEALQ